MAFDFGAVCPVVYSLPTSASLEFGFIETSWSHVPVSNKLVACSRFIPTSGIIAIAAADSLCTASHTGRQQDADGTHMFPVRTG